MARRPRDVVDATAMMPGQLAGEWPATSSTELPAAVTSPPGYELLPYECHEGNYMLPHSLSAERDEDAAIEADAKKGIIRKRKSIQQNLDAGARPIPGRTNPNDDVDGN